MTEEQVQDLGGRDYRGGRIVLDLVHVEYLEYSKSGHVMSSASHQLGFAALEKIIRYHTIPVLYAVVLYL